MVKCEICGQPMPEGEEMFRYHGFSGPCPKPESNSRKLLRQLKSERIQQNILKDIRFNQQEAKT